MHLWVWDRSFENKNALINPLSNYYYIYCVKLTFFPSEVIIILEIMFILPSKTNRKLDEIYEIVVFEHWIASPCRSGNSARKVTIVSSVTALVFPYKYILSQCADTVAIRKQIRAKAGWGGWKLWDSVPPHWKQYGKRAPEICRIPVHICKIMNNGCIALWHMAENYHYSKADPDLILP